MDAETINRLENVRDELVSETDLGRWGVGLIMLLTPVTSTREILTRLSLW